MTPPTDDRPGGLAIVATLGLAIGGPVALLSGILTAVTVPTGMNGAFAVIFLIALGVTVLAAALYLSLGIRRNAERTRG